MLLSSCWWSGHRHVRRAGEPSSGAPKHRGAAGALTAIKKLGRLRRAGLLTAMHQHRGGLQQQGMVI
jgi:hypothetical protein